MFVCDFILNGECQLLSKDCHDKCKINVTHIDINFMTYYMTIETSIELN